MPITYVEIEDRYKPKSTTDTLEVSVILGNGQTGAYLTFLEQTLKGANRSAKVGKATEVIGKRIIVSATVVDLLDETNWTSATINIKEGSSQTVYGPYSKEAAKNLDTICFLIKILCTNEG